MTYTPSSPVFGTSITPARFATFLRSKGSPAAAEATPIFAALGPVDPAVALGQFGAESSFGKAGYAKVTRNWGNIAMATPGTPPLVRAAKIATHWSRAFGATPYSPGNGYTYAKFPTWAKGAAAYRALLNTYRLRGWASSITVMCRRWLGGTGTAYIANIVRIANQAAAVTTPPVVQPPAVPAIDPVAVHLPAKQMTISWPPVAWTAEWIGRTWVASAPNPTKTFVLVHGGPIPADNLGGMDALASWLASSGARAVVVEYPTIGVHWADALAPLKAALADYPGAAVVAHSLGGYFGSLVAYSHDRELFLVAADDQIGDTYRASLGNGPDARTAMAGTHNRVTVIAGSHDPVTTVAEAQDIVNALHATGHPGRFLVIDGATHDNILSDQGAVGAIIG